MTAYFPSSLGLTMYLCMQEKQGVFIVIKVLHPSNLQYVAGATDTVQWHTLDQYPN